MICENYCGFCGEKIPKMVVQDSESFRSHLFPRCFCNVSELASSMGPENTQQFVVVLDEQLLSMHTKHDV